MDELFQLFQQWCAEHPAEREGVYLRIWEDESGGVYRAGHSPHRIVNWTDIADGIEKLQKKVKQPS